VNRPTDSGLKTSYTQLDTLPANNQAQPKLATQLAVNQLYPLSLAQQQIWVAQVAAGVTPIYNLLATYHIHGEIDTALFQQACELSVQHFDSLQTAFVEHAATEIFQYRDTNISADCDVIRLDNLDQLGQWSMREGQIPLNIKQKCFRFKLAVLPDKSCVFHFSIHHLIADGGVLQILWEHIAAYYRKLSGTKANDQSITKLTQNINQSLYRDHVASQAQMLDSKARATAMQYWLDKAAQPFEQSGYYGLDAKPGYDIQRTYWQPESSLLNSLQTALDTPAFSLGSKNKSLFVLLATVIIITAAKTQANSHQRLGFPVRSRNEKAYKNALGVYISIGFLDIQIEENDTIIDLANKIKNDLETSMQHLDSSIQSAHITRAFNTSLNIILAEAKMFNALPVTTVARMNGYSDSSTAIALHITDFKGSGQYEFMFDMATSVFSEPEQARYVAHFQSVLSIVVSTPDTTIANMKFMTDHEIKSILSLGTGKPGNVQPDDTLQKRFSQICSRVPDAIAISYGNQQMSYAVLDQRSEILAVTMQHRGVQQYSTVAIHLERSCAAYVAILAVLKTGARFLPLDPRYPQPRLEFMLIDSEASMLLTQAGMPSLLANDCLQQILLNAQGLTEAVSSVSNAANSPTSHTSDKIESNCSTAIQHRRGSPSGSAYLMYTSGSTGEPKGIVGTHSATLNRLEWMWRRYPFDKQAVCVNKTALSFVDSISEIFGPLLQGITTVIFPDEDVLDIFQFVDNLEKYRISRLIIVPSLLSVLLDSDQDIDHKLRHLNQVVVSGEPLPSELARRFHATLKNTMLLNLYGSTEVSADVTYTEVHAAGRISTVSTARLPR